MVSEPACRDPIHDRLSKPPKGHRVGGGGSGERLSLTVREGAGSVLPVEAITNIEENIGKTVGRRRIQDSLEFGFGLQRTVAKIQEGSALRTVPKGVFKFRSFQEADAWMMHHLTAPRS